MKAPTVRTAAAVRVIWASYSRGSTDAMARSSSTACGRRPRVETFDTAGRIYLTSSRPFWHTTPNLCAVQAPQEVCDLLDM